MAIFLVFLPFWLLFLSPLFSPLPDPSPSPSPSPLLSVHLLSLVSLLRPVSRRHRERLLERQPVVEEEPATKKTQTKKKSTWGTKREEKRQKKKETERDSIQNIEICNVDTRERERVGERPVRLSSVPSLYGRHTWWCACGVSVCAFVCVCVYVHERACVCVCAWPGLHLPLYQDAQTEARCPPHVNGNVSFQFLMFIITVCV